MSSDDLQPVSPPRPFVPTPPPIPSSFSSEYGPTHSIRSRASLCSSFAEWLENQKQHDPDRILVAVERDGTCFLTLARCALAYENALLGRSAYVVEPTQNPLGRHAKTLRDFADLVQSKASSNSLSGELELAIERDGSALFHLAQCCLDFDRAIQGSDVDSPMMHQKTIS